MLKINKLVESILRALTYGSKTQTYIPRSKPQEISQVELTAVANKFQMI